VNITRSWIKQGVDFSSGGTTVVNLTDVEIGDSASKSEGDAINTSNGKTVNSTRVYCHDHAKCWSGFSPQNVNLSYCTDIYGFTDSHNECVLFSRGNQSVTNSNLVAKWGSSGQNGGGMSAVLVLYSHIGSWDDIDDVTISGNRFDNQGSAAVCTYSGYAEDTREPTNITWTDNVYVDAGCQGSENIGWCRAADEPTLCAGNSWSGNEDEFGNTLSEPATNCYNFGNC
jgi:hypothetical protein